MTDRFHVLLSGQWREVTSAEPIPETGQLYWEINGDESGFDWGIAKHDEWRLA